MKVEEAQREVANTEMRQLNVISSADHELGQNGSSLGPRIALLTPYNGGNLGDAAIQDAMIANLRSRLPDAQFSGICLNCDNFKNDTVAGPFLCAKPPSRFTECRMEE